MSNKVIKEFVNKQRMKNAEAEEYNKKTGQNIKTIDDDADVIVVSAPLFGLDKWAEKNLPNTPEIQAYMMAEKEQKVMIVVCVILITVIVNYLKYGVP